MARFNSFLSIGNNVSAKMFGANALYNINTLQDGSIRDGYLEALTVSGARDIRFPGGLVEIDFNVMQMENGKLRSEVVSFLDDVRAKNKAGAELSVTIVLPTQSYIAASAYVNFAFEVSKQYSDLISAFEIGNEYSLGAPNPNGLFDGHPENASVRPTQFGITEATYGRQVERIAKAIDIGIQQAKSTPSVVTRDYEPDILMQMSDIVGASSSFLRTNDHGSADKEILSQITSQTMELIDGFVGHYYYNKNHTHSELFDGSWREVRSFPDRIESWNSVVSEVFGSKYTNKDISFTEWNTNIRTIEQLGLKGASVSAKQFEYMIEMGADSAFIWPLQHNTNTSIAGHFSDSNASLSPSGLVFSTLNTLLNPKLNGEQSYRSAEVEFSWLDSRLDTAAYTSDYGSVFVISNRSNSGVSERIKFSEGFSNIKDAQLFTVGIDQSTSDGLAMGGNESGKGRLARRTIDYDEYIELSKLPFFDANNANHIKIVGNSYKTYIVDPTNIIEKFSGAQSEKDFWFLAEPDVSGELTSELGVLNYENEWLELVLDPFAVAILKIEHSKMIEGSAQGERLDGGFGADTILARGGNDTLFGHEGDDTLKGGWGDDYLSGGTGNNYLVGSAGNDIFDMSNGLSIVDGGSGVDIVSYARAEPSIRVDLLFDWVNARAAKGDSFSEVENLIGTTGADNIRGTFEANILSGSDNVDYIFGRRGDDTLNGGIGNDVLFGGLGSDILDGGNHRDRAQYSEALSSVRVSLEDPRINTGEAEGDIFKSIEDLAGSSFDDELIGNGGNNSLYGREGNDALIGLDGEDYLNGGSGDDTLDGGSGNDILRGGIGADIFIFRGGHDVIEDFNAASDEIEIIHSQANEFIIKNSEKTEAGLQFYLDEENSLLFLNIDHQFFVEMSGLFQ